MCAALVMCARACVRVHVLVCVCVFVMPRPTSDVQRQRGCIQLESVHQADLVGLQREFGRNQVRRALQIDRICEPHRNAAHGPAEDDTYTEWDESRPGCARAHSANTDVCASRTTRVRRGGDVIPK